jgi:hypothetical protein
MTKTGKAKRNPIPKHFPCSVISIAFRSARVIMCDIELLSIIPENGVGRKGYFEQKRACFSPRLLFHCFSGERVFPPSKFIPIPPLTFG